MRENIEAKIHEELDNVLDVEVAVKVGDSIVNMVNKDTSLSKVEEFMETFNQVIGSKPNFPDDDIIQLRLSLMLEELTELAEACGSSALTEFGLKLFEKSKQVHKIVENKRERLVPSRKDVLDALCDQRYVNDGTILAFGMKKCFEEAFHEVHESNMSKICLTTDEARKTYEKYKNDGIETTSQIKGGGILILREGDKKVLKSINYKEADVSKFL